MEYRQLGTTDMKVATISFGAWAIGGSWGSVNDETSKAALRAALDAGVNFIDTADVYGDGRSERLIAEVRKERKGERVFVATKCGRRLPQKTPHDFTRENLRAWVERSLKNLEMEALDLLQLHCPHPAVYDQAETFGRLDELVAEGKLRYYGVSVQTVDEALRSLRHPHVQSVQIIFNMFRLKPAEAFFQAARERKVGILARVPLASGLLTGKLRAGQTFASDDHRQFNREGQSFDKGETFSGVPYDVGLQAVEELRRVKPAAATLTQFALRWTLQVPEVTCAIPGAKTKEQARENAAAAELPPLGAETMAAVARVYDERIRSHVHASW